MSIMAKKRWKILADILSKGRCQVSDDLLSSSVRRFSSFGLLKQEKSSETVNGSITEWHISEATKDTHTWYKYTCDAFPEYALHIRLLDEPVKVADLLGFNNTGNICVWPSEEILTYYCLQHEYLFRGKSVCELGGGMTCLAGISIAVSSNASRVMLTDGNENSVSNLMEIIDQNRQRFKSNQVEARLLRWNECYEDLVDQFDWIICADCLFFDEFRLDLVKTMLRYLKAGGHALIFAPSRGDTFDQFVNLVNASKHFSVLENTKKYDDLIWTIHTESLKRGTEVYDESLHYPRLLMLCKDACQVSASP